MMDHDSTEIAAAAFITWINTFGAVTHKVDYIHELADGITLFEVLADIDSRYFKLIRSADVGNMLSLDFSKLPVVDLAAIAKDSDVQNILLLCKLILYIAVFCPDNERYIQAIQTQLLPQQQEYIMISIDQVIKRISTESQTETDNNPSSSYVDDGTYRSQSELSRVSKENEELEKQNKQLIEKHSSLLTRYDKLESDKQDLQERLKDMDTAVAQAHENGKTEFVVRTELGFVKRDLQKSEDIRQEQEGRLEDQAGQIKQLTHRNESLLRYEEEAIRLKDQIDEYRHTAEKLQKAENVIEKYKKKLEESANLRKEVKDLETANHELINRNQDIEDQYRNVLAFKTLMDSYKDQVATLETKNNELMREKNKLDYELNQYTKKMEVLEADRARDSERIQSLEDHLQEAQLGMTSVERPVLQRTVSNDTDDMELDDYNLNDSLEDSLKESNVTELKLSKRRLEREIKTLKEEHAAGRNPKTVVLQHLLDDANRLKNQFEKNYLEVSQERDILQSDMARIRQGIPDSLLDQSEHTLSLRLHSNDLEKQIKSLNETIAKLEQRLAEGRYEEGMDDIRNKHDAIDQKSKYLEEQTKKQLQDINKLLLEKDLLQSQSIEQKDLLLEKERLNSEMKASLAAFEAKDDEPFKQHNAQLQQQIIQLQEQLHELNVKHRKAKEFIKQQDKMLKESKLGDQPGNFDEAITSLKAEAALRDEEYEKIKKQLHETRLQSRREQQLMISAWYDLSRKSNKEIVSAKSSPSSWLGGQRHILDNQLKRR
ncbi:hypothetical protein INT48_006921 [Thamnidium elegans]|uniref:Hook C-terminal domain-containing protein n=1 Tax=Thamnidium elegans TaxID=101142 RepID=A0A8H7SJA4_9FUNG|nr:hypothetical protein INT48_006921 [Thamnidium elegans]